MTALNTAAIEYTMGNTFAVGLAGEYGVDDNNEVVFMVIMKPVEWQQRANVSYHSYVLS